MALIPDNILEQVRLANPVEEVIGAHLPLKKRGANLIALCPFHQEKTPSFNVNPHKQIWHCFGCGAGGDVFKFVMQFENLPFVEAVQRLAEKAGITLQYDGSGGGPTRDEKDWLFKLHEQTTQFFQEHLQNQPDSSPAKLYLLKRGITPATVKRWRLGLSPAGWDHLITWALGRKFSLELLESAGLVLRRDTGGHYDRFRSRLMFPISDDQGRVVGFSGRILTEDKEQPKYVNSPETAIFHKGRILFAMDKAKRPILEEKLAIICEGQLDTISCHEAGLTNVVAPQGTAFTDQHARILKRHTDEVVLMFDGDEAGQKAAVRNAEPLWELGVGIRVALLPEKEDPDSFLKKHGPAALRELLAQAPGFFEFLLQRLSRQFNARTERGKVQIAEQMVPWLTRIHDPILQATFAQRTANRLDVREEVVRQAMRNLHRPTPTLAVEEEPDFSPEDGFAPRPEGVAAETMLLRVMLDDDRIIEMIGERLDRHWLSDSLAAALVTRTLDLHAAAEWNGPALLVTRTPDPAENRLLSATLLQAKPSGDPKQIATDCLRTLERDWIEQQQLSLRRQLADPALAAAQLAKIQQQILANEQRRRALTHSAPR